MRDDQPIIVIKKNKGHAAHHGGAWKVAFADFMTAMMAFFLVMWILGLSQPVRKSIQNYFNDPLGAMRSHGGGKSVFSQGRETLASKPRIMIGADRLMQQETNQARYQTIKTQIQDAMKGSPDLEAIKQYVDITESADGLRVELMDGKEPTFFRTGQAQLQPRAIRLLALIGKVVRNVPNGVSIEGHTDARPYPTKGYTNWDLSNARALAALKQLEGTLRKGQIVNSAGFADKHLRRVNDPYHFSNRRVSILVQNTTAGIPPKHPLKPEGAGLVEPMHLTGSMREEAGSPAEKHPYLR